MFGCQLAKRGQCVLSGERLVGGKHTGRLLAWEAEWVFTHNVTNAQTGDNVWARYGVSSPNPRTVHTAASMRRAGSCGQKRGLTPRSGHAGSLSGRMPACHIVVASAESVGWSARSTKCGGDVAKERILAERLQLNRQCTSLCPSLTVGVLCPSRRLPRRLPRIRLDHCELRHSSGIFVKLRLTGHQVCGLVGSGANQPPTTTVQGRICQAVTSPFWT